MSKPKRQSMRARATRALNDLFGSPSDPPTAPPSASNTPVIPPTGLDSAPCPSESEKNSQLAASASPPPTPGAAVSPLNPSQSSHPSQESAAPSRRFPKPLVLHDTMLAQSREMAWGGLTTALRTLHSNAVLFPPLQSAVGGLLAGFDAFEESTRNQREYEPLVHELKMLSETLSRRLPESTALPMMEFIVETIQSIQEQVDIISKIQGHGLNGRLLQAQRVEEAISLCYQHIQALSRQLQIDTDLSTRSEQQNAQIEGTKPAKLAIYNSSLSTDLNRRACTENTRTGVLSDLNTWLVDPNSPKVCWMNGMAGTGKTTIAYTFAQALEKNRQLAASFFCTRTTAECREVTRIVPSIAYQLARYSGPFLSTLCRILSSNPDLLSLTISTQFEKMLKEPLLEIKQMIPKELVVIIDALDECTANNGVELVLDILLREGHDLPLKFLVTSRPEPSIRSKIQEQPESSRSIYELHNVKESEVQADIELYIREELPSITQSQTKQLAKLSGSLFIYAATAVRYIRAGNRKERLKRMLSIGSVSNKGHAEIDELYRTILFAALNNNSLEDDEIERIKLVLWTAVCARETLSVGTIAALLGFDDSEDALSALEPLRSVLYVSEDHTVVSTLHASFPDYLFDSTRSSTFFCDASLHHEFLSRRCFGVMRDQLRFNVCGLESSYLFDDQVLELERRVDQAISATLAYACRYWVEHLEKAPASEGLHAQLHGFLSKYFLFWMEVMNLKRWIGLAVRVMLTAKLWILTNHPSSELRLFVEDARNFVTSFAANPVSRSTPHIYVSALPFCQRSSAVYKQYWKNTRGLIEPKGAGIENRHETALATWKVNSKVHSVAYSPDGTRIAIGCRDGRVLIRNTYDGAAVGAPLQGHTEPVCSVAFSPNGAYIVSGCSGRIIRMWDVQNGTALGTPIQGHSHAVTSVVFSPDAAHVASGSFGFTISMWRIQDGLTTNPNLPDHIVPTWSAAFSPEGAYTIRAAGANDTPKQLWEALYELYARDSSKYGISPTRSIAFSPNGTRIVSGSFGNTVRLWEARDGSSVGTPLQGHAGPVTSAVFSTDGTCVVSGSLDQTIRVWNIHDDTTVSVLIQGHSSSIWSVAFSPDNTRIVSGSDDKTIRVWDASSGDPVGAPLQGHTGAVMSVTFSPDGTCIVSGSQDDTIRMWNIRDEATASIAHLNHAASCLSIAFSPDGTRVVSGSRDATICIWNTQDGSAQGPPLRGHTGSVNSIAFSPDGSRIVSGSCDTTLRMWAAHNGDHVNPVLEGHTNSVTAVAFSPDGTRVVSGSEDKTIRIWDVQDGTMIGVPSKGHTNGVLSVAFSLDGTRIASGSWDNTVRLWDARDGSSLGVSLRGHTGPITSVAFSPDGKRLASCSQDDTIRFWNAKDWFAASVCLRGHTRSVRSIAFSPDGAIIVSGSHDRTIRIWGSKDGSPIGTPLIGHANSINSIAFSPDGTYIVSGSDDKTIRMWNIKDLASLRAVQSQPGASAPLESLSDDRGTGPNPTKMALHTETEHVSSPATHSWVTTGDGWIRGDSSQLLFWVPHDLAHCLPSPNNVWVAGSNGSIYINYESVLFGGGWVRCYRSL